MYYTKKKNPIYVPESHIMYLSDFCWFLLCTYLDFFGPKWHSLRSLPFQGPKKFRFLGPPPQMALVMDIPLSKPLRIAPHKQQVY